MLGYLYGVFQINRTSEIRTCKHWKGGSCAPAPSPATVLIESSIWHFNLIVNWYFSTSVYSRVQITHFLWQYNAMTIKYVICSLRILKNKLLLYIVLGILPIARRKKQMVWHWWWVARTRIRVIQVNFDPGRRNAKMTNSKLTWVCLSPLAWLLWFSRSTTAS